MNDAQIGFIVLLVIAICEAVKQAGLPSRWIPLLSVILGIIGSYYLGGVNFLSTIGGVILGLSTTGGYRLVKTTILNS